MICYRDKTWCLKACDGCPDALTDKVRADAEKWWESFKQGPGAPIAYMKKKCRNPEKVLDDNEV